MTVAQPGTIVGVDIGGTKTQIGHFRGERIETLLRAATPRDPDAAARLIGNAIAEANLPAPLGGVGVGCPGPLSQADGVVLAPPNLPEWRDFPLAARLSERLGVPVRLENDANAGALGEALHGSGRGCRGLFYMTISTGLGTGTVVDGRIWQGHRGLAGDIWCFRPGAFQGEPDLPNLNDTASGTGLVKRALERMARGEETGLPREGLTAEAVVAAMEAGDPVAVRVVERARDVLAAALAFVVELLAPDVVTLAGGLCRDPAWMVEPVRERFRRLIDVEGLADVPIRRAALWDEAVLYGAVELFREA